MNDMAQRHPGLTHAVAEFYTEGARVCLDRHHEPPVDFEIANSHHKDEAVADWKRTDERIQRAWANEIDATEAGAYACALAAVEMTEGLVAIYRAETKTGADYYIAPVGSTPSDLEGCLRLEVSGVDRGDQKTIAHRLKLKLDQAESGVSNLQAMVGVVGFRARIILLERLEES